MTHSLHDLKIVNSKVNLLPYVAEIGDDWTPITEAGGDCDSYATAKLERLIQHGWPREALRLATCWVENGGYHAVLLADFDGQTYVLDNRYPLPMEFNLLPYKWDRAWSHTLNAWEYIKGAEPNG